MLMKRRYEIESSLSWIGSGGAKENPNQEKMIRKKGAKFSEVVCRERIMVIDGKGQKADMGNHIYGIEGNILERAKSEKVTK